MLIYKPVWLQERV